MAKVDKVEIPVTLDWKAMSQGALAIAALFTGMSTKFETLAETFESLANAVGDSGLDMDPEVQ